MSNKKQQQNHPQQKQNQETSPQPNQAQPRQPQQAIPKNPADPGRGRPQHFDQGGTDESFGKPSKSRGAEDESRGKEGGVSPGAQEMQRDKFSGERLPRRTE